MASDYLSPVLDLVRRTTNNRDGMRNVVKAGAEAISGIDNDVADLLTQREKLRAIYERFFELYRVMTGEELLSKEERPVIDPSAPGTQNLTQARKQVLQIAAKLWNENTWKGGFDEGEVLDEFRKTTRVPWQNPNAVIATILTRSGTWEKGETGNYRPREDPDG